MPAGWRIVRRSVSTETRAVLKSLHIFELARSLQWMLHGSMVGSPKHPRGLPMFASLASRQTATAFAGAFVSALLFVSAATSLPLVA
jgi:hypothetical protein